VSSSEAKKTVRVLVTDLDNTLYDWVEMWSSSFGAMLRKLVEDSGIQQDVLEREFQAIHQRYGTSEYAFSIQELPSLRAKFPGEDPVEKFDEAIHEYRKARKRTLRLYPSVKETLEHIKSRGCLIVGYTESMAFYSNWRVRALGLDGALDYLYSPEDHDLPQGLTPEQIRRYPADRYRLNYTIHRHTPKGVLKPSAAVLLGILREIGADPSESAYVGDNLVKDVLMAQTARVTDVYARYGAAHERPEYELLRRVTHWPPDTVDRERQVREAEVVPSYTLSESPAELKSLFDFRRFVEPIQEADEGRKKDIIEIWKKTVEVQEHFNELELKLRNYALTMLVAVLAAAGFLLKENMRIQALGGSIPLAALLLLVGLLAWIAFYFMDRWGYHRLLYGAVEHGLFVEARARSILPELALTAAIGRASPLRVSRWTLRSPRKIDLFYGLIALIVVALAAATLWVNPQPIASKQSERASTAVPSASKTPTIGQGVPERKPADP
jgi:FMN phosphatase YigB (HAD superfamily)